jgi:bacillithiol biosynthesis cysteine-adding enzyme BshC
MSNEPRNIPVRPDSISPDPVSPDPANSIAPFLAELPRSLRAGRDLDLLLPSRLLSPGELPPVPPLAGRDAAARRALGVALLERNRALGHPLAEPLAEALADVRTEVVVAGQQPGLFGGPLYTLTKLIATVLWAERLDREGRRAVPVFWIASSDHDWQEIAACCLSGQGGLPERLALERGVQGEHGEQGDRPSCAPVGSLVLGDGVLRLLEDCCAGAGSERYRAALDALGECYLPSRTFADAFASWWIRVLGRRCPLLLDAQDPTLARLASPLHRQLLRGHHEHVAALAERERDLVARGYDLPVRPQPDCPPLFVIEDGERFRVRLGAGGYSLRGGQAGGTLEQLDSLLEQAPERISPGVLARPAVQDAVLSPTLFLVGPGELAYMTQAAVYHQQLGIAPATVALRPHALVLDHRRQEHLAELARQGVAWSALLGAEETFEGALARAAGEGGLDPLVAQVMAAVDALGEAARAQDGQLEAPFEKTRSQIERALEALGGRVRAAVARRDGVLQQRARQLRELCVPGGGLAERRIAALHFLGLYGPGLVDALWSQLDLDAATLSLVDPEGAAVEGASEPAEGPQVVAS